MPRMSVFGSRLKLTKNKHASKQQMNKREFFNSKRNKNWKECANWKRCELDLPKRSKKQE